MGLRRVATLRWSGSFLQPGQARIPAPMQVRRRCTEPPTGLAVPRWSSSCWRLGQTRTPRTDTGWTPLHGAACHGRPVEKVQLLLAAGADPNTGTDDGWTPLRFARKWVGLPAIERALIAAGAVPTRRDNVLFGRECTSQKTGTQ